MASQTTLTKHANETGPLRLSPNAEAVLRARYLRKDESGKVIEEPVDLFMRVADAVASAEKNYGLSNGAIETIRDEFFRIMTEGKFMPNSPTLMNAGRGTGMLSACFVLPVEDSIDSIFSSIHNTALIQKAGGGTGFSFSRLRPKGDRVASSGGATSGPISFMKVFGKATDAIQQGAFRRGANMGIMRIDHPDIIDFIDVKQDLDELTNFNLSVGLTDEFLDKLYGNPEQEHVVCNPRNGAQEALPRDGGAPWTVGEIFDLIIERAWATGEPGVILLDRINEDNPTPQIGTIEATNPCGEQPLLPYESCNLGSINLAAFVRDADGEVKFDFDEFREVIKLSTRFLDNVIDINKYPLLEIATISRGNRKIGLGVMGFADALFALGIPYDSDAGVEFGERVMQFLGNESHKASEKLAAERGAFPNWQGSTWAAQGIAMRNACTTTVAPTGTVSIIANCSGGIEPLFSLVFFRNVLDGKRLTEVNSRFLRVAQERGFHSDARMAEIGERGSIQDMGDIPGDVRRVFVTAHDVSPESHVRMQATFQKHCDASISKTINFQHSATPEDIRKVYLLAFKLGCKGITVYRDGCRDNQPMALAESQKAVEEKPPVLVKPLQLPEVMSAVRIKQVTPFGNMHIKVVVDPATGRELEVFAQLGKGGDVACSDLEAICRLISLYLRTHGSLDEIVNQLDGIGSSLSVPTKDGRIASLADGVAKAIQKYQRAKGLSGLESLLLGKTDLSGIRKGLKSMTVPVPDSRHAPTRGFKVKCPECGANLIFEEGCINCLSCGYSRC